MPMISRYCHRKKCKSEPPGIYVTETKIKTRESCCRDRIYATRVLNRSMRRMVISETLWLRRRGGIFGKDKKKTEILYQTLPSVPPQSVT